MVRLRDCHPPAGKVWAERYLYGAAHSDFYIIDNNGNILSQPKLGPSKFQCDPWGMALAIDSTYYLYEQDIVSKTNKNFCIEWQRGFGGSLTDEGIHAITADTGVLSTENGVIYKYDKYGHKPPDNLFIRAVRDDSTTIHFYLETKDSSQCHPPAKWDDANIAIKIKDFIDTTTIPSVWYMWKVTNAFGENTCNETYRCISPGENGILDLNKKEQLNALIIDLHGNEGAISIEPKGYREIIIKNIKYKDRPYNYSAEIGFKCSMYGKIK
jgi:hypothetical protein